MSAQADTITEELYYSMYEDLKFRIEEAYFDYYLLEEVNKKQGQCFSNISAISILNHLFDALQVKLCLDVWKICLEPSDTAGTLNHLKNYISKVFIR